VHRAIDDQQLTRLALTARRGTPAEVDAFTRAVYTDVRRFVSYLAGANGADDLTQETFVRVLQGLPKFAGRSSARTWLLSIARRVVVDRYRAAACRPVVADLDDWERAAERRRLATSSGPEEAVVLEVLMAQVPPERRAAFLLTQVLGFSYAEAAETLNCPIGTVRSRVSRARTQLVTSLNAA
jgi:RNA polymerase sigma-70 factor, ECF subfamily